MYKGPPLVPADSMNIEGVSLNYSCTGLDRSDHTPVVVLLHGFGASLGTWDDICPTLGRHYPVVRLDLKGFGFSGKPQDDK